MMRNDFNKRVEIWTLVDGPDGFGGTILTPSLLSNSWANLKTSQVGSKGSDNLDSFGIVDQNNLVIFTVRKRNDLDYNVSNMYIMYRGLKYTISTAPTNINFGDNFISFAGLQETDKSNANG
jgi:hypothetical protein